MSFSDKVAIVTGGSNGIGLACARKLSSQGAAVVLADIDADGVISETKKINEKGGNAIGLEIDVTKSESIKEMVGVTLEKFPGIDILVNSAGIQRYGTAVETDEQLWDEVIDTNLKSIFLAAKYTIPYMEKRGGGSIVNISSVQAFATQKGVAAYTASKGGINALTRALAVDHAKNKIRVNAVCPASIDTPMLRGAADLLKGGSNTSDGLVEKWGKMHPVARVGKVEEIAEFVAYLCSSKAEFITGGSHLIDGGLLAQSPVVLPE